MKYVDWTGVFLLALLAFVIWGLGYLLLTDMHMKQDARMSCIQGGKDWVVGSCIGSKP